MEKNKKSYKKIIGIFLRIIYMIITWISLNLFLFFITNKVGFLLNIEQSYQYLYSILAFVYSILMAFLIIIDNFKLRGNPWNPWD